MVRNKVVLTGYFSLLLKIMLIYARLLLPCSATGSASGTSPAGVSASAAGPSASASSSAAGPSAVGASSSATGSLAAHPVPTTNIANNNTAIAVAV